MRLKPILQYYNLSVRGREALAVFHSAAYTSSAVADCGRNFINLAATVAEQL